MEIRQLEYFLKAGEHKNLSAAARELFITEQALSKSIVALEKEFGFSLFVRDRKGVALTPAGETMRCIAAEAVDEVVQLKRTAAKIREGHDAQPIRIGFFEGFLGGGEAPLSTEMLIAFQNDHPEIALHIFEDTNERIRKMTCEKELDLGVFSGEVPATCCSITLHELRIDLAVARASALARSEAVSWSDLRGQRIVVPRGEPRMRDMIGSICRQRGFDASLVPLDASPAVALAYVYSDEAAMPIDRCNAKHVDRERAAILRFHPEEEIIRPLVSVAWSNEKGISSNHYKITDLLRARFNRTRAFV